MQESHSEGPAIHAGHESCLDVPQGRGEALTVESAGGLLSSEITLSRMRTPWCEGERNNRCRAIGKRRRHPAESENLACVDTPCAGIGRPGSLRHQRHLVPATLAKERPRRTSAHAFRESDSAVVPAKSPNKGTPVPAEAMEGRSLTKRNVHGAAVAQAQTWIPTSFRGVDVRQRVESIRFCRH
jgi:hypothetical protein